VGGTQICRRRRFYVLGNFGEYGGSVWPKLMMMGNGNKRAVGGCYEYTKQQVVDRAADG